MNFFQNAFFSIAQVGMKEDAGMNALPPHLMDHRIDGRMRIVIDQHRIVMMRIRADLIRHFITQEQRLVIKIDLDIHGAWVITLRYEGRGRNFPYFRSMTEKIISTNEKAVAERLLQAQAIRLSLQQPFTWSSGWTSPIYCDNRKVLGHPYIRDFIKSELCNVVFARFPEAALLAGVATAGIPWGAMVADQLKLPYVYVRSKPKGPWPRPADRRLL